MEIYNNNNMNPSPIEETEEIISPTRLRNQTLIKDTILCSICKNLLSLVGSKICSSCGEQVCINCTSSKCPVQNCDPKNHNGVLPRPVREELENLEILCKFDGCPYHIHLKDVHEHQKLCKFRKQKCEFCNSLFESEELEKHKKTCTQRLNKCEKCSFMGKLHEFQHDCKVYSRIDSLDKKIDYNNLYIKKIEHNDNIYMQKIEELENKILNINKLLNISTKNKNIKNIIDRRFKKRKKIIQDDESTNNSHIEEVEAITNINDSEKSDLIEYTKISHLSSYTVRFTAICEMKILNCLIIGFSRGEIKSTDFYKYNVLFYPKHEGYVTYLLDLETPDFKFITSGKDNKLIIRKYYDKHYFEKINQQIYSLQLVKTYEVDKIISVDMDNQLRIWDIINKSLLKTIHSDSQIYLDRFKKDESVNYYLLSAGSTSIDIYDFDNLSTPRLKLENKFKICFILYYQGDYFLTIDENKIISLWDIKNHIALDNYKYKGKGVIIHMFIVRHEKLAFVTSHRDIHFLDLHENKFKRIKCQTLLMKKGENLDDIVFYGKFNNVLAIFKKNSHNLYLFKF